jgi:hypothetical protein
MDADDAIILASELPGKGAVSFLNLANTRLCNIWTDQEGNKCGAFDASGMFNMWD